MASDNEASCVSDPNFAVICSFLECFGKSCGINYPDIARLQEMLEDSQEVPQPLIELHVKLLRKLRKTVSPEKWERALVKFCHTYSNQDGWELERFGYKKARIGVKLRLLKVLLEAQFDSNARFKLEVNKLAADELRVEPLGRDKTGLAYWFQLDNECNIRVYREDLDEENWELVARDREGVVNLINSLTDGEGGPIPVNEDSSNSLGILEKPIIDTGQAEESPGDQDEETRLEGVNKAIAVESKSGNATATIPNGKVIETPKKLEEKVEKKLNGNENDDGEVEGEEDEDEEEVDEDEEEVSSEESGRANSEEDEDEEEEEEEEEDEDDEGEEEEDEEEDEDEEDNVGEDNSHNKAGTQNQNNEVIPIPKIPDSRIPPVAVQARQTLDKSLRASWKVSVSEVNDTNKVSPSIPEISTQTPKAMTKTNPPIESIQVKSIETPVITTSPLKLVNIQDLQNPVEDRAIQRDDKFIAKSSMSFQTSDTSSPLHAKYPIKPIDKLAANLSRIQSEKLEKPGAAKLLEKIAENLARTSGAASNLANGEDEKVQDLVARGNNDKACLLGALPTTSATTAPASVASSARNNQRGGINLSTSPRGWETSTIEHARPPIDYTGIDLSSRKANKIIEPHLPNAYTNQEFQHREMDLSTRKIAKPEVSGGTLPYDSRTVILRNHATHVTDLSKKQMYGGYEVGQSATYHTAGRIAGKEEIHRLPNYTILPDPSKLASMRMAPVTMKRPHEIVDEHSQQELLKRMRSESIAMRSTIEKRSAPLIGSLRRDDIVGPAIEEPVMMVQGEGSGSDCDAVNPMIGEAIEETVLFFYGEGNGQECDTGNPGDETSSSDNKDSNESKSDSCTDVSTSVSPAKQRSNAEGNEATRRDDSPLRINANCSTTSGSGAADVSSIGTSDNCQSTVVSSPSPKAKFKPTLGVQVFPRTSSVPGTKKTSRWDVGRPEIKTECDSSYVSSNENISIAENFEPKAGERSIHVDASSTSDIRIPRSSENERITSTSNQIMSIGNLAVSSSSVGANEDEVSGAEQAVTAQADSSLSGETMSKINECESNAGRVSETEQCDSSFGTNLAITSSCLDTQESVVSTVREESDRDEAEILPPSPRAEENTNVGESVIAIVDSPPRFFFGPNCVSYSSKNEELRSSELSTTSASDTTTTTGSAELANDNNNSSRIDEPENLESSGASCESNIVTRLKSVEITDDNEHVDSKDKSVENETPGSDVNVESTTCPRTLDDAFIATSAASPALDTSDEKVESTDPEDIVGSDAARIETDSKEVSVDKDKRLDKRSRMDPETIEYASTAKEECSKTAETSLIQSPVESPSRIHPEEEDDARDSANENVPSSVIELAAVDSTGNDRLLETTLEVTAAVSTSPIRHTDEDTRPHEENDETVDEAKEAESSSCDLDEKTKQSMESEDYSLTVRSAKVNEDNANNELCNEDAQDGFSKSSEVIDPPKDTEESRNEIAEPREIEERPETRRARNEESSVDSMAMSSSSLPINPSEDSINSESSDNPDTVAKELSIEEDVTPVPILDSNIAKSPERINIESAKDSTTADLLQSRHSYGDDISENPSSADQDSNEAMVIDDGITDSNESTKNSDKTRTHDDKDLNFTDKVNAGETPCGDKADEPRVQEYPSQLDSHLTVNALENLAEAETASDRNRGNENERTTNPSNTEELLNSETKDVLPVAETAVDEISAMSEAQPKIADANVAECPIAIAHTSLVPNYVCSDDDDEASDDVFEPDDSRDLEERPDNADATSTKTKEEEISRLPVIPVPEENEAIVENKAEIERTRELGDETPESRTTCENNERHLESESKNVDGIIHTPEILEASRKSVQEEETRDDNISPERLELPAEKLDIKNTGNLDEVANEMAEQSTQPTAPEASTIDEREPEITEERGPEVSEVRETEVSKNVRELENVPAPDVSAASVSEIAEKVQKSDISGERQPELAVEMIETEIAEEREAEDLEKVEKSKFSEQREPEVSEKAEKLKLPAERGSEDSEKVEEPELLEHRESEDSEKVEKLKLPKVRESEDSEKVEEPKLPEQRESEDSKNVEKSKLSEEREFENSEEAEKLEFLEQRESEDSEKVEKPKFSEEQEPEIRDKVQETKMSKNEREPEVSEHQDSPTASASDCATSSKISSTLDSQAEDLDRNFQTSEVVRKELSAEDISNALPVPQSELQEKIIEASSARISLTNCADEEVCDRVPEHSSKEVALDEDPRESRPETIVEKAKSDETAERSVVPSEFTNALESNSNEKQDAPICNIPVLPKVLPIEAIGAPNRPEEFKPEESSIETRLARSTTQVARDETNENNTISDVSVSLPIPVIENENVDALSSKSETRKEASKRLHGVTDAEDFPPSKSKPPNVVEVVNEYRLSNDEKNIVEETKNFTQNLTLPSQVDSAQIPTTILVLEDKIAPMTAQAAIKAAEKTKNHEMSQMRDRCEKSSMELRSSEIQSVDIKCVDLESDDSMGMDNQNTFETPAEEDVDPLACAELDFTKRTNSEEPVIPRIGIRVKPVADLVYEGWKLDSPEPPSLVQNVSRKRRNSAHYESNSEDGTVRQQEEDGETGGKRMKLRGKRSPDIKLRKSVEANRPEIVSSEDEANKSRSNIETIEIKDDDDEVVEIPTNVNITATTTLRNERKPRGRPRGRRRRGNRSFPRPRPKISPKKPTEESTENITPVSVPPTTDGEGQTDSKKKRKKRKMVLGLEIGIDIAVPESQGGTGPDEIPVRQSRRIAQLKIKEEADKRRIEEETLCEITRDKKDRDGTEKKKRKKQKPESEEEPIIIVKEVEREVKARKKRKKKKMSSTFNEAKPWQSSSGSSSDDEGPEDEDDEEIESEGSLLFKSDHEFSPESDLEKDEESEPMRRARTAQKAQSDVEEAEDEYACQKCGKADHPEWILLCDTCDKGWHCSCLRPALMLIPEGDWFCPPCQHNLLVNKLRESLKTFDQNSKRHENEVLRKKRLAFVDISLDNVLKNEQGGSSGGSSDQSDNESTSSSSGSSSSSSSSEDSEPVYQLRERRCANTYKFNEYDDMINAAIQDEVDAVQGAGNQGRGKDIATIVNAEKEEAEAESLKTRQREEEDEEEGKKSEKDSDEDYKIDKEDMDEEEEDHTRKTSGRKMLSRKKHRKLNSLDISSEDDPDSDEDFKGSSSDEEEDFEDQLDSSDDSFAASKRRGRKGESRPVRRSTRAARTRYDADFVNDDSEDSDRPKRKKSRSIWEASESEDSDNSWRQRKKRSRNVPAPRFRVTAKSKPRKKKKRKRIIESDNLSDNEDEERILDEAGDADDQPRADVNEEDANHDEKTAADKNHEGESPDNDTKREASKTDEENQRKKKKETTPKSKKAPVIRRKIIYGGLDDDGPRQEEETLSRRTRGRKINYQDIMGSDSEEELKKVLRKTEESEDEFVVNEGEELNEDVEKDSDSGDIYSPKKELPKGKAKSPKSKKMKKSKSPAGAKTPTDNGTPKQRKKPGPKPGSKNKPKDQQSMVISPIQVKPSDTDSVSRGIDMEGSTMSATGSMIGEVPEGSLTGLTPDDINALDDEQLEQMMMEDEEYGRRQLELAAIEIAKNKKQEEREAKKLEKARLKALEILAAEQQRDHNAPDGTDGEIPKKKKRGRRSKAEILAEQMRRDGVPSLMTGNILPAAVIPTVMPAIVPAVMPAIIPAVMPAVIPDVPPSSVSPGMVTSPTLPTVVSAPMDMDRSPGSHIPMMAGPDGQLFSPDGSPLKPKRRGRGKGKKTLALEAARAAEAAAKASGIDIGQLGITGSDSNPEVKSDDLPNVLPTPGSSTSGSAPPTPPTSSVVTSQGLPPAQSPNQQPQQQAQQQQQQQAQPVYPSLPPSQQSSVITRMLQSQPVSSTPQSFTAAAAAMGHKYFGGPNAAGQMMGGPRPGNYDMPPRGRIPSPYRQSVPSSMPPHFAAVRSGTPPMRMRVPGAPMYHTAHHPMDPSPSGGGPISINSRDRSSPLAPVPAMIPPAARSPLAKGGPTPPPPPYVRGAPAHSRFTENPQLGPRHQIPQFPSPSSANHNMQQPSPPPNRAPGNFSPYHPPPPPNYHYGAYPPPPPMTTADDAAAYQGSPYSAEHFSTPADSQPQQIQAPPPPPPPPAPQQPVPPQQHPNETGPGNKQYEEEGSGEFGGLVSYFSSQREDDLDS